MGGDPAWAKVRCGRRHHAVVPAGRQTAETLPERLLSEAVSSAEDGSHRT